MPAPRVFPEAPFRMQTTHDQPPNPGEPLEILLEIQWLRMPLPFALNHVNLWLLQDAGGWTAVDTGFAVEALLAGGKPRDALQRAYRYLAANQMTRSVAPRDPLEEELVAPHRGFWQAAEQP